MPNAHDEGHNDGPTIEVSGARFKNNDFAYGGGGAFYNFGGGHDAFHFTSPYFADGGGGGFGNGSAQAPGTDGPGIVVTADPFPLTNQELLDAIRTIVGNLQAFDFGDYRLQVELGVAQLQIFDHRNGTIDSYTLSTKGGSVFSDTIPQPDSFNLPPGFQPSGPQFDIDYGFDFI